MHSGNHGAYKIRICIHTSIFILFLSDNFIFTVLLSFLDKNHIKQQVKPDGKFYFIVHLQSLLSYFRRKKNRPAGRLLHQPWLLLGHCQRPVIYIPR